MPYNGYSEEYLDRLENGNIASDNKSFSKRKLMISFRDSLMTQESQFSYHRLVIRRTRPSAKTIISIVR